MPPDNLDQRVKDDSASDAVTGNSLADDHAAFDSAFDEVSAENPDVFDAATGSPSHAEPSAGEDKPEPPSADPDTGDVKNETDLDDTDETDATDPSKTGEDPADPPAEQPAPAVDTAAEIAALKAQIESLKTATKPEQPAAPEPEPAKALPTYTDAENESLNKYMEDWPEVANGEKLLRRAEYQQLVQYMFNKIHDAYGPTIEYIKSRSGSDQYNDIVAKVPDYDDVLDKTLAWVETQPTYIKTAYEQVIQSGTADEVADMIARFKQDTGYVDSATQNAAAAPAATNAPATTKGAAPKPSRPAPSSLKLVQSSRSGVVAGPDPNDFDSAFEEFVKQERR